jgi:hypothetical protein
MSGVGKGIIWYAFGIHQVAAGLFCATQRPDIYRKRYGGLKMGKFKVSEATVMPSELKLKGSAAAIK